MLDDLSKKRISMSALPRKGKTAGICLRSGHSSCGLKTLIMFFESKNIPSYGLSSSLTLFSTFEDSTALKGGGFGALLASEVGVQPSAVSAMALAANLRLEKLGKSFCRPYMSRNQSANLGLPRISTTVANDSCFRIYLHPLHILLLA